MTQPQDPRKHPLQDDEIALARVLRALPAGEPPPRVDAAILAAATDALNPRPRKPAPGLRWLPTWAVGTAAAAVLAVGIGIQLRPPLDSPPLPSASRSEQKPVLPEARERLSVDLIEPERELAPMPAPPPPQPGRVRRAPPAPPAPRAPPPPPELADAAAQAFPSESAAAMDAAAPAEEGGAFAPPPATSAAASEADDALGAVASRQRSADAAARDEPAPAAAAPVAQGRSQHAPAREDAQSGLVGFDEREQAKAENRAAGLPPVAEDAKLAPRDWIERIRVRRNLGDRAGARDSLMLFIRTHPEAPIPTDLARLR